MLRLWRQNWVASSEPFLPRTWVSLGAPHNSNGTWDPIEERFRRLAIWKCQYISKGGRVTLIRSTLSNLPIYFMSLFWIPSLVCKRLEKIKRNFLWGGGNLDKNPNLVKWATVYTDKKVGGLGVRGLYKLNKALLGKWNWRFTNERNSERNSLWRETISRKFGGMEGGCAWERAGIILEQACGKKSGKTWRSSWIIPSF